MPSHHFLWTLCCPVPHNLPLKWLLVFQLIHNPMLCCIWVFLGSRHIVSKNVSTLIPTSNLYWSHCCTICSLSSNMKLSSLQKIKRCNNFQLLLCSRVPVGPSLYFLQTCCDLIKVYHSVSYFVCRLFTESTEVSIKILPRSTWNVMFWMALLSSLFFWGMLNNVIFP